MKSFFRKAVVMTILMLLSLWASAQVYIGGSIAGSYVKSPSANAQSWSINVKPEAGYFLKSNLALGGRISYGKTVTKIEDANNKDTNTATNLLTINPYAAFAPYEHGKFSFGQNAVYKWFPNRPAFHIPPLARMLRRHFPTCLESICC